ncbi:ATP-binding protein [Mycolicibacterium neworleansense]|uniref:Regulatory protein LuxR n=1 Tax=Mycolicibacterium neworleansense TaxID=146018 RepID=A0A0H5RIX8_9MYCO|nr:AAA family ATPase [Mycolicibacterium neworleansense]CRZ13953.1 regulatory protein LuxR [Mycolicibacterium neworleansense]
MLTERDREFAELTARAATARAGRGGVVIVSGESGCGKTSFVEAFVDRWPDGERVLWGACDPLSTPRPLGPIHDLACQYGPATQRLLRDSDRAYEIFAAVFEELRVTPSILVIDDMHWADQGTVDLLRYMLRRIGRTRSLIVGVIRDEEVGAAHPLRLLLGDVARSGDAISVSLPPLSLDAVAALVGDRGVDPIWLHRTTGGNAFFVTEMLDHTGDDLPTTVRDVVLSRTAGLDTDAWDLLHLLACASGAIPDVLLADLGVAALTLRSLDEANLIRRSSRGIAFRHDLCRLAITSVIPPGLDVELHRRMIHAYEASPSQVLDSTVLTHHALGAGDHARTRRAASEAGHAAARSGAHKQAAQFYRIALDRGGPVPVDEEAELLELLADEYFLTDRLDDAIAARQRALLLREQLIGAAAVSANHHALALYESNNANHSRAEHHATQAVAVLEDCHESGGDTEFALLGHAVTTLAYFAVLASKLIRAAELLCQAKAFAAQVDDPSLVTRIALIDGYRGALAGEDAARDKMLSSIRSAAALLEDDIYSNGCTSLVYLDIEQRRLSEAAELLDVIIPLSDERDVPLGKTWLLGMRTKLELLLGDWDTAAVHAETVLGSPSAPLARMTPILVRALVSLRRDGTRDDGIDEAWRLLCRFGEHLRLFAASAIAEQAWLTGVADDRLAECRTLLDDSQVQGLTMARGELAVWLHRLGLREILPQVAEPYRLVIDGAFESAADEFDRLSMPYEVALALTDSGDARLARRGLDTLDELGADAAAAKVRRDLRARGLKVPARRRTSTMTNPAGLTPRQIEVLRHMDGGSTNAELAERLHLSVRTVDHHVSAILSKLQVTKRRDALHRAHELGIID